MKTDNVRLNENPVYMHSVCGFNFHITWNGRRGVDQYGAEWINVATNNNSIIPEPVNPKYLDVFFDAFNTIKQYFK